MFKPTGWDEAPVKGEYEPLELGGHVCVIKKAESDQTKSGRECIRLYLDIAEGRQKGYYEQSYKADDRPEKRWGCTYTQLIDGDSMSYAKGMFTAIEKSNPGYKWSWDESTLKGKMIGGVFGREQYINAKGDLKFAIKCMMLRSIDAIRGGVDVPPDKLLGTTSGQATRSNAYVEISKDDELPW